MNVLRKTDGYTEIAAVDTAGMIELYASVPGSDHPMVTSIHFSEKLAWRLGLWLLRFWVIQRWCGLRAFYEARQQKSHLFQDADTVDQHSRI